KRLFKIRNRPFGLRIEQITPFSKIHIVTKTAPLLTFFIKTAVSENSYALNFSSFREKKGLKTPFFAPFLPLFPG
ncbi:hypothetical protein LJC35_01645, partial [Parabacteroides sp. OttesenSCG-928-N08]|nr:hypothetical protein [Parabacteroides sp. OttesenSCG-928-N08]